MHRLHFCIFLFFATSSMHLHAQHEGANWFFGNNQALNFSEAEPKIIYESPMKAVEGCASYSTPQGDLLFFTNGGGPLTSVGLGKGEIYDADFNLMYDMQGIEGGGASATQSSIIFPVPGGDNQFYLFTMEAAEFNEGGEVPNQPQGRGLSYFIIDMNANAGLGAVVQADERVYVPSYENLTAVMHDNLQDYWVIISNMAHDQFIVFPVNNGGIGNPTFFDVPTGHFNGGTLKASPDRTRLYANKVLYDFDASNGVISNPVILSNNITGVASFSSNSQYLYTVNKFGFPDFNFYQFDLTSPDIASSYNEFAILTGAIISQLQLAPDHHIYFIRETYDQGGILERISCANSSNPKLESVIADHNFGIVHSLPNFTDHLFRNDEVLPIPDVDLGPDINNCEGQNVSLDAGNPGMTYQWSTGDTTQVITVQQSGVYSVTVSNNCCQQAIDEIIIFTDPAFELLSTSTEICGGELVTVPIDLTGIYPMTISYLNNGSPEVANLNILGDSLTVFVQGPTLLSFSLLSNGNCSISLTDEFTISFIESDTIYINESTCSLADTGIVVDIFEIPGDCNLTQITHTSLSPESACIIDFEIINIENPTCFSMPGGVLTAQLNQGSVPVLLNYVQLDGDVSGSEIFTQIGEQIVINELAPGNYEMNLEASNGATSMFSFSILIDDTNSQIQIELAEEQTVEYGDSVLLAPDFIFPTNTLGRWEDALGNILCQNCTSTFVQPFENSVYYFIIENEVCSFEYDILLKVRKNENVFFPNSFSPNDDGNNDVYQFFVANNAAQVKSFRIYDRWGQLAFAAFDVPSGDPTLRWDGRFKEKKYNPGVFVYFVELVFADGTERRYKGDILLIK